MAEKYLQSAQNDYISVVINLKNLRFMTLIKEDCLISDLIKEVEKTFAKLCSVKVKIKTLKNSVNAVLPDWYPVAPLIRNQDEIYAFTDNTAEVLNIDLSKHGNCGTMHNATSPLGSGVMSDSGFTSPVTKPQTSGEPEGRPELTGTPSQDEGNELLSEIFSLKDHNQNTPKQKDMQVERLKKKTGKSPGKGNTDDKKDRDNSFETEQGMVEGQKTSKKTQDTKAGVKKLKATNSPRKRNDMLDDSQVGLDDSLGVGQEGVETNLIDEKGMNKSNDKAAMLEKDSNSSSDWSDESSWDSSKEEKNTKKNLQQKKSLEKSENNKSLESDGFAKKAKETNKEFQQQKPSESSQNDTNLTQKLQIERKNSSKTRKKSVLENSVPVGGGLESDSSDDSIVDEAMDVDKKHENKNKKSTDVDTNGNANKSRLSLGKRAKVSGEKEKSFSDENMEVDVENVEDEIKKSGENLDAVSEVVSKSVKAVAKAGNKESEPSDGSSENEDIVVDMGGDDSGGDKVGKTSTNVESKKLKDGKADSAEVSGQKGNKLGKNTLISDQKDQGSNKEGEVDDDTSSDSSSSDSDTDSGEEKTLKKPKNDTDKEQEVASKKSDDVSKKNDNQSGKNDSVSKNGEKLKDNSTNETAKKTENIQEMSGDNGCENKSNVDEESVLSVYDTSWSSSDDDDVKTTNKTTKNKNETKTQNDEFQMDFVDGDKSKDRLSKNKKTKTAAHGEVEDNTKVKSKRKDAVTSDDKDKQTNLETALSPAKSVSHKKSKGNSTQNIVASPAKSVGHKKSKESSTQNIVASPAKSIAHSKKSVSKKNMTDLSKNDKRKLKDTEVEAKYDNESSVSTLKTPFAQLPAKDKARNDNQSGRRSGDEDAVKKCGEVVKDGKKKGKQNSADKTGHVDKAQPNDPNIRLPQTPSTSTSRKSAAILSASKVASWLLSNPVSDNVTEGLASKDSSQKSKKHSKNKTSINVEVTSSEIRSPQKTKTHSKNKRKENIANVESIVDKIESDKTLVSPKEKSQSQKRKLDEVSEQEHGNKHKKNKKKKSSDGKKNEKQQLDEETQDKQSSIKPVRSNKGKNTSLSLPKISKGLLALLEDESDYNTKCSRKTKKQKLTPPIINRRVKQTGFLTPSKSVERKSSGSKTPKSRIKKIPSSLPSKTIEMNATEQEFLNSGAVNLETLLNDESIKW